MLESADTLVKRAQQQQRENHLADARQAWLVAFELLRREDPGERLAD